LLSYVAQHILSALSRREAQQELERRVDDRTQELRQEVHERQRSEKLQRALFRIAELSGSSESMDAFYASVHEIVGELLDAHNFFIALLTDDGNEMEFPYWVDEHDQRMQRRKRGHGLSEYVVRTGKPLERRRAHESLRAAYAELEQRVQARTSELADTNRELLGQISERERMEFKLKHEALHDTLTGLPNRSQLLAKLGQSLTRFR